MTHFDLTLPEIALVAATRGMLGAGAGLLLAPELPARRRRTVGLTLFFIGLVSTVPLALRVFYKRNAAAAES